jgi:hypothetical protein
MDTNDILTTEKPIRRGLFGSPFLTSGAFLIGILLFFMPFFEFKCNTVPVTKVTGINLATGYNIKSPMGDDSVAGRMERFSGNSGPGHREPYTYALVALSFAMAGFLLSWLRGKVGTFSGIIFGVFSFATMIVMLVDIKRDVRNSGPSIFDTDYPLKFEVVFTIWFFLATCLFALAAIFSFLRTKTTQQSLKRMPPDAVDTPIVL